MTRLSPIFKKKKNPQTTTTQHFPRDNDSSQSSLEGLALSASCREIQSGWSGYDPKKEDIITLMISKTLGYGRSWKDALPCNLVMTMTDRVSYPALITGHITNPSYFFLVLSAISPTLIGAQEMRTTDGMVL